MSSTLKLRITERYPELSPQERRAADMLLDHLGDLGSYRATELAALAGVSKATISRLVRRLGFDDFEEMREHLRTLRGQGLPVAVEPAQDLGDRLRQEVANLERAYAGLDVALLDECAAALAAARHVVIVGQRSGHPVAADLRRDLAQVRGGVTLAPGPGQSLAEDLIGLGADDVAVVVSFRRHAATTVAALDHLVAAGVPVLLLADPTLRRFSGPVRWWIECPIASTGAFDSHAAAMSLTAVLVDRVLDCLPGADERIERIDHTYVELHETGER